MLNKIINEKGLPPLDSPFSVHILSAPYCGVMIVVLPAKTLEQGYLGGEDWYYLIK